MFKTILPSNASKLELAFDKTAATRFDHDLSQNKIWSAQHCPIEFLPFLAWALSVDIWDSAWPEYVKRNVIESSAYVHRHKGTAAGIKSALQALDLGVQLSEWFDHDGDPYTFRADVMISERGLTDREYDNIVSVIAATKNARSHLSQLRVYLTAKSTNHFACATVLGERIDVYPWVARVPVLSPHMAFAASTLITEIISVGAPE